MILFKNFLYGGSIVQNKSDIHIGFLQANTAVVPCKNVVAFYFILVVFYLKFIIYFCIDYIYIYFCKSTVLLQTLQMDTLSSWNLTAPWSGPRARCGAPTLQT